MNANLALLIAIFTSGQASFEITRIISSSLYLTAIRKTGAIRWVIDFLDGAAALAGLSVLIWVVINWVWWKGILLWAATALLTSFISKLTLRWIARSESEDYIPILLLSTHLISIGLIVALWITP